WRGDAVRAALLQHRCGTCPDGWPNVAYTAGIMGTWSPYQHKLAGCGKSINVLRRLPNMRSALRRLRREMLKSSHPEGGGCVYRVSMSVARTRSRCSGPWFSMVMAITKVGSLALFSTSATFSATAWSLM